MCKGRDARPALEHLKVEGRQPAAPLKSFPSQSLSSAPAGYSAAPPLEEQAGTLEDSSHPAGAPSKAR